MTNPNYRHFLIESLESTDYELIALAGDASSRRYSRVYSGEISWVLMDWEPFQDEVNYPFLNIRNFLESQEVRVPKVKALAPDKGLVLLEDLGDLTLERKFWENLDPSYYLPFYKQTLDELLKIHRSTNPEGRLKCGAFDVAFDQEKFLWELNYAKTHLLEGLSQINLSASEESLLSEFFNFLALKLDQEPKRMAHRDFHSRNVMLHRGQTYLIDFQDARMGPIQYDLVSLFYDSYVDLSSEVRSELLDYYLEGADFLGPDFSKEQFQNIFEIQLIQRCFKACGSFASFYQDRSDTRYLKYIKPTLSLISNHLNFVPEGSQFKRFLEDKGLFGRDFKIK